MRRTIRRNKDYVAAGGGKFEIKARRIRREIYLDTDPSDNEG